MRIESAQPRLDLSRPAWMGQEGGPLYDTWAKEVLETANDNLPVSYINNAETSYPAIRRGTVLSPHDIVRLLFQKDSGLVNVADKTTEASKRHLVTRKDEILHYTSAGIFTEETSEEELVIAQALDSIRFATGVSVGLIYDVFTERVASVRTVLNGRTELHPPGDRRTLSVTHKKLRDGLAPLWDASLDEVHEETDLRSLQRTLKLQNLAFVARSLGNPTLHACLEELSVAPFFALRSESAILDTREIRPLASQDKHAPAVYRMHGWQFRAHRFGLLRASRPSQPKAVLLYDSETNVFSTRPETISYLRQGLREQNQEGLSPPARETAGNIQNLTPPLSIGCPVHNRGSISLAGEFAGAAFNRIVEYHHNHPIT